MNHPYLRSRKAAFFRIREGKQGGWIFSQICIGSRFCPAKGTDVAIYLTD